MKIYHVVSIGIRLSLIHVVEALSKSIAFQSPSLFWDSSWFTTKTLAKSPVTSMGISTKELLHEGRGSPHPPHKAVVAAPHQAEGSMTCQRATKTPRGGIPRYNLWFTGSLKNQHTRQQRLALSLSLELILALTLLKLVLNLRMWSMSSWVAWRTFSECEKLLTNSSHLK
jgi:hypothetical protein